MAEQEIIKHTKRIYRVWNSKEHSPWQKIKEFLVEIFIIVFAVTISIWLHNRSEYNHQQEDVRVFLLGLKSDLNNDLNEMENDKQSYLAQGSAFKYIKSVKMSDTLQYDSLTKYYGSLFNTTALNPNNGRFEGFKASGKIGNIEDKELQNDILDLYQEDIVALLTSTNRYIDNKKLFSDYVIRNMKRLSDSTTNMALILKNDEAQNISIALRNPKEVLYRYDKCIEKAKKIIGEIDKKYLR